MEDESKNERKNVVPNGTQDNKEGDKVRETYERRGYESKTPHVCRLETDPEVTNQFDESESDNDTVDIEDLSESNWDEIPLI